MKRPKRTNSLWHTEISQMDTDFSLFFVFSFQKFGN